MPEIISPLASPEAPAPLALHTLECHQLGSVTAVPHTYAGSSVWLRAGRSVRAWGSAALIRKAGELLRAHFGHRAHGEEDTDNALLDEEGVLRERIRQPLARPLAVLGREPERGRQLLQANEHVV